MVKNSKKRSTNSSSGSFRKTFRDAIYADATTEPPTELPLAPDVTGALNIVLSLTSLGAISLNQNANTGLFVLNIEYAQHLKLLGEQAGNFHQFRILSANLVFLTQGGTQAVGILKVFSIPLAHQVASDQDLGIGAKACSLSRTAEFKIPLQIDSSWKPCTKRSTEIRGGRAITNYTIQDLLFCNLRIKTEGAAPNRPIGKFYIDLDAEFRYPKS
jgi:hypothetical protein